MHIHSNPANRDVKMWQVNYLLKQLVCEHEENGNVCLPLVLCGDINFVSRRGVHTLLTNGSMYPTNKDFKLDPCGVL